MRVQGTKKNFLHWHVESGFMCTLMLIKAGFETQEAISRVVAMITEQLKTLG